MLKLSRVMVAASAAALVFLPAGVALAQGAPSGGTAPAATPTPAAPEAKVTESMAPENKAAENTGPEKEKAAPKKKKQPGFGIRNDRSVIVARCPRVTGTRSRKSIISIFRSISSRT